MDSKNIVLPDYNHSILNTINSILKYYQVPTKHHSLTLLDEKLEKGYQNVILLILDGMGSYVLDDISNSGYFKKNLLDTVTSVYPSTTTAALTTYYSGMPPFETGYIAWSQYFKEYGRQLDMLSHKDSYTGEVYQKTRTDVFRELLNYESIFEKIESQGIKAYEVEPSYAEKRSKRSIRCENLDEIIETLPDLVKLDGNKFIMAYCDNPDSILHKYGTDSQEAKNYIKEAEKKIKKMVDSMEDTIVIISADHGHKNIEKVYSILDYPDLYECLYMPESLESRCVSFSVKEDKKEFFHKRFLELFGDEFLLLSKEEIYENHLLGFGEKHKKIDDFIGDFVAISISSSIFQIQNYYFPGKNIKKSTHCGLTKEEMMVPLIVIEKEK